MNIYADEWKDYEILDAGDGMKLERWKDIILARPDPQAIWAPQNPGLWKKALARYERSNTGGGRWIGLEKIPKKWTIKYKNLDFYVEPTNFKHTGLFPEQAANWEWMSELVRKRVSQGKTVKVLNLFGYTGGATVAVSAAGAKVCHVDASKGIVQRAKENAALSHLEGNEIRYIVDDAFKFVAREIRRGNTYDGIIMDPPSYGRGPGGEVWKLEDCLYSFVADAFKLMSSEPLFFLLNSYTTGFSSVVTSNMIKALYKKDGGIVEHGDLCIPITSLRDGYLPCGSYACWKER